MSDKVIIDVKNVEVCFYIHGEGINSFKQWLFSFGTKKLFKKKTVLSGITFQVNKGDCVGFLGSNGSGKSTILKVIAGVVPTESGSIQVNGKVAPMLALGVGLQAELSGYENIKIVCALMGMESRRVKGLMESIIDFSELSDEDLKMQIKRYSSGMKARLGFAMAVVEQPEILIIDEALSVGDAPFREKCNTRIDEIREKGTTILFVSHGISDVKRICNKAVWLDGGKIVSSGDVETVTKMYQNSK